MLSSSIQSRLCCCLTVVVFFYTIKSPLSSYCHYLSIIVLVSLSWCLPLRNLLLVLVSLVFSSMQSLTCFSVFGIFVHSDPLYVFLMVFLWCLHLGVFCYSNLLHIFLLVSKCLYLVVLIYEKYKFSFYFFFVVFFWCFRLGVFLYSDLWHIFFVVFLWCLHLGVFRYSNLLHIFALVSQCLYLDVFLYGNPLYVFFVVFL